MEILITIVLVIFVIYIVYKNFFTKKSSSCNCGSCGKACPYNDTNMTKSGNKKCV